MPKRKKKRAPKSLPKRMVLFSPGPMDSMTRTHHGISVDVYNANGRFNKTASTWARDRNHARRLKRELMAGFAPVVHF